MLCSVLTRHSLTMSSDILCKQQVGHEPRVKYTLIYGRPENRTEEWEDILAGETCDTLLATM